MSNTISIKDFFSSSEINNLFIPRYQRNYAWTKDELRELWNDISNITVSNIGVSHKHFIGLLVLVETNKKNKHCDVVDGQQRLTTFTILLAVIRDIFTEESAKTSQVKISNKLNNEILQINNLIFTDSTATEKERKLIPNELDKPFFNDLTFDVRGESEANPSELEKYFDDELNNYSILEFKTNYIKSNYTWKSVKFYKSYIAYEFFYESIKKQVADQGIDLQIFLKDLKRKCLEGVHLMKFVSSDETEAFNLFETLNDRGLGLAAADLIKNKLLSRAIEKDREQCNIKWNTIFGVNGIIQPSLHNLFLRHFYNCHNEFISKQDLYSGYRSIVLKKEPHEILNWLSTVENAAKNYIKFKDVFNDHGQFYYHDFDLQNILLLLKKTGSLQWYTVAFALSKAMDEDPQCAKECFKTYWLLYNLIIRFITLDVRFNYLEKRLPKIARSIWGRKKYKIDEAEDEAIEQFDSYTSSIKYAQECIISLIELHTPDTLITNSVFNNDFRDNNIFNSLLRLCYLIKVPHGHNIDADLTLEHVLPVDHSKWADYIDVSKVDLMKYKLGNGLLIRKDFNSSLQNQKLEDKHPEYIDKQVIDTVCDSNLNISNILQSKDWNFDVVNARTNEISELLKNLILNKNLSQFRKSNSI